MALGRAHTSAETQQSQAWIQSILVAIDAFLPLSQLHIGGGLSIFVIVCTVKSLPDTMKTHFDLLDPDFLKDLHYIHYIVLFFVFI